MANPGKALAALNGRGIKVGPYVVRELTLGLAGVLEAIGSPLQTGAPANGVAGWIPTIFAMTRPTEESALALSGGPEAYRAAANEWADTVPVSLAAALIRACCDSARRVSDVQGDQGGPEKK